MRKMRKIIPVFGIMIRLKLKAIREFRIRDSESQKTPILAQPLAYGIPYNQCLKTYVFGLKLSKLSISSPSKRSET